jgi:hypothetical protein
LCSIPKPTARPHKPSSYKRIMTPWRPGGKLVLCLELPIRSHSVENFEDSCASLVLDDRMEHKILGVVKLESTLDSLEVVLLVLF